MSAMRGIHASPSSDTASWTTTTSRTVAGSSDTATVRPLQPTDGATRFVRRVNPSARAEHFGAGVSTALKVAKEQRALRRRVPHEPLTHLMGHQPVADDPTSVRRPHRRHAPPPTAGAVLPPSPSPLSSAQRRAKAQVPHRRDALGAPGEGTLPPRLGGKAQVKPVERRGGGPAPAPDATYRPQPPWHTSP